MIINKMLEKNNLKKKEYYKLLITNDLVSEYELGYNYCYNFVKDKVFYNKTSEIKLTKIQLNIIKYLINTKKNEIQALELYENCWVKKKKYKSYVVRNMIKQIRNKTFRKIIIFKKKGYSISREEVKNRLKVLLLSKINQKQIEFSEYLSDLIIKDIKSKILLQDGFYYNLVSDKLFNNNSEIKLSNLQKKLLKYMLENRNKILSPKDIFENTWGKKSNFCIYSLRNVIKQIRDKTTVGIIKNYSNIGYSINSL